MSFLNKKQTQLFMQIANCIIPPTDNLPGAGNLDVFDNKECDLGITPKQENHIIEFLDKSIFNKNKAQNATNNAISILCILISPKIEIKLFFNFNNPKVSI